MSILQDAGWKIDPRVERYINEWAEEAEKEIQYDLSVIQSLCVGLLSSLLGAGWGILVAVVMNAETDLLWWQWVLALTPILIAGFILVLGVPYYLKWVRKGKQERWQATVKEKTRIYAEHLRLKDENDSKIKAQK